MTIYQRMLDASRNEGRKLAILVDPDKAGASDLERLGQEASTADVDFFFVGGSLLSEGTMEGTIPQLRRNSDLPIVLFPGSTMQVHPHADAILFLSLISGRNPELLIGRHVEVAPFIKRSGMEVIPTGYMLIDGGKPTSASYMSNTLPIPYDKPDIAASTALAGEMLGMQAIYLEAGSGALNSVSLQMVEAVGETVDIPIIVGGGVRDPETAHVLCEAGADIIVVGTRVENDVHSLHELTAAVHEGGLKPRVQVS